MAFEIWEQYFVSSSKTNFKKPSNIEMNFLLQTCPVQRAFYEDSCTNLQSNWFMKITGLCNSKFETGTLLSLTFLALYFN